jgi:hypothetical protein
MKKNKNAATALLLHTMNFLLIQLNACDPSIGSENWCAITSWVELSYTYDNVVVERLCYLAL